MTFTVSEEVTDFEFGIGSTEDINQAQPGIGMLTKGSTFPTKGTVYKANFKGGTALSISYIGCGLMLEPS